MLRLYYKSIKIRDIKIDYCFHTKVQLRQLHWHGWCSKVCFSIICAYISSSVLNHFYFTFRLQVIRYLPLFFLSVKDINSKWLKWIWLPFSFYLEFFFLLNWKHGWLLSLDYLRSVIALTWFFLCLSHFSTQCRFNLRMWKCLLPNN